MATALLSLVRNKIVTDRLVMTGELSLTGQVLPIGGLKEKTIAARRNKAKHIIIPKQNERDLDEIPDYVKKGINFHPVDRCKNLFNTGGYLVLVKRNFPVVAFEYVTHTPTPFRVKRL
jgi:ATP-dependent Lon protease